MSRTSIVASEVIAEITSRGIAVTAVKIVKTDHVIMIEIVQNATPTDEIPVIRTRSREVSVESLAIGRKAVIESKIVVIKSKFFNHHLTLTLGDTTQLIRKKEGAITRAVAEEVTQEIGSTLGEIKSRISTPTSKRRPKPK